MIVQSLMSTLNMEIIVLVWPELTYIMINAEKPQSTKNPKYKVKPPKENPKSTKSTTLSLCIFLFVCL